MSRRNVRDEMIQGAIGLLAQRGVQGTSFAVVTETTKTPRGSIYHHFPGGKNELIIDAVGSMGTFVTSLIDAVDASSPADVVQTYFDNWRLVLLASNFENNCAIANTTLGAGDEETLRRAARNVFEDWHTALTKAFVRSGCDEATAKDYALVCISASEGALILGRASRNGLAFDSVTRQIKKLVSNS